MKDWIGSEATIMRPDNKEPWIFVATGGFDDPASDILRVSYQSRHGLGAGESKRIFVLSRGYEKGPWQVLH